MNKCEHNEKINLFCISQHCQHKQSGGCSACIKKYHNHISSTKYLTQSQLLQTLKKFTNIDHSYKPNCRSIQQAIYAYFNSLKQQTTNCIQLICKTLITQLGSPYMFQKNIFSVYKRIKNNQYKKIYVKDLRKFCQQASIAPSVKEISKQQGKLFKQYLKRSQKFIMAFQNMISNQFQMTVKQWIQNYRHDKSTHDVLSKLMKQTLSEKGKSNLLQVNIEKELQKAKLKNAGLILEYERNGQKFSSEQERSSSINKAVQFQGQNKNLSMTAKFQNNDSNYMKNYQNIRNAASSKQKSYFAQKNVNSGLSLISSLPSRQQTNHKFGVKDFSSLLQKQQKNEQNNLTLPINRHKRQVSLDKRILDKKIDPTLQHYSNYNSVGNNNNKNSSQIKRNQNGKIIQTAHKFQYQNKEKYISEKKPNEFVSILTQSSTRRRTQQQSSSTSSLHKNSSKQNQINVRKQQLIEMMKNNSAMIRIGSTQKKTDILNVQSKQFKSSQKQKRKDVLQLKLSQQKNKQKQKDAHYLIQKVSPSFLNQVQEQFSPIYQKTAKQKLNSKKKTSQTQIKSSLKNQFSLLFQKNSTKNTGNILDQSRPQSSARRNLSVVIEDRKSIQQYKNQLSKQANQSKLQQKNGFQQAKTNNSSNKSVLSPYQVTPEIKRSKSIEKIIQQELQSSGSIKMINGHSKKDQLTMGNQQIDPNKNIKGNMKAHSRLPVEESQEKQKEIGRSRLIIVPAPQKFNLVDVYKDCQSPLLKRRSSIRQNNKHRQKHSQSNRLNKYGHYPPIQKQQQIFFQPLTCDQNRQNDQHSLEQKSPNSGKKLLKQNQQKSLNLLLKSVNSKPFEAISLLQQSLKQAPNNLSAAEYLSFLYLQNNKPREALNTCNSILQRFIITNQNKQSQELLLSLQTNKAAALNMLGRWSETIVLLQKCLKSKQSFTSNTNCCQHLMLKNLGDAYYFNSNHQKAVFYYQKAIKLNSHYDQAYFNMSVCLYLQNNFHNAKMAIQKALSISENAQYIQLNRQISNRINKAEQYKR